MKRTLFLMLALALTLGAWAQSEKLKVETFYLSNGLKVIMAEEHSQPKIYGEMLVHAGSKNEELDATGVAHYFEHIMFKGTDRIGTTDWEQEKPLLDAISAAYDRLHATADDSARHAIQLEINELNKKAMAYAIPNEVDAILQQMGCTGLNAGTGYDGTAYFNTLPSNQLENWMQVYAERFRRPIFRLFQSELEAVYEERNMYSNEQMYTFIRNLVTESFGEHPYARDIIGLDDHLKNPQPSAMEAFFQKYYVAKNMCLILVGDFDIATAKPMAEKYFSILPSGEKAQPVKAQLPQFETQVVKEVKQTPIKMGLMVFPGVKQSDPDYLPLSVLSVILSNGKNGLDVLSTEGKLLEAQLMPLSLVDAGSNVILYVPKLLGQKHAEAEELIWAALDSVKEGRFTDKQLESVRISAIVSRKRQLEDYASIASLLSELESEGSDLEQWEKDMERLQNLTKEDVMAVAKKYFSREHCTLIRSSMGFPEKSSAIKPDWDHLEGQNKGVQSPFAQMIAANKPQEIVPQVINFEEAVEMVPVTDHCTLYSTKNPKNDLFSICIAYHYGKLDNRDLGLAVDYFEGLGCDSMTHQEYNLEQDCLGGNFAISVGEDYSYIYISGPEEKMEDIIALGLRKLSNPRHDAQQIKNLVENLEGSKKSAKEDADTWTSALKEYVYYGNRSEYLDHATIKEVKKMKGEDLMAMISNIFGRDGYVTYVGNRDAREVASLLMKSNLVREKVEVVPERTPPMRKLTENEVYYSTNKKFLQSNMRLFMQSGDFDIKDRAAALAFNEYYGGGMNSIIFQEIREFRSLGYATYGTFGFHERNLFPCYLFTYLGTQCDKTFDGIEALRDLMLEFPDHEAKFATSQDFLVKARNSNYITFRSIPSQVRYWREVQHLDHDPRAELTKQIESLKYSDLRAFYNKYIQGRPMVIILNGNDKKFDAKALQKYGKVHKVEYKQMMKF